MLAGTRCCFESLPPLVKTPVTNPALRLSCKRAGRGHGGGMENKTATEISSKLLAAIASGMTVREAFAAVLPAVDFDTFAGEVYDALCKPS